MTSQSALAPGSSPAVIPQLHDLGIPSPAYIRKLRKSRDWEGPIEQVVLFDADTPEHSVYLVSTDLDLYLCIAALNAKRKHEDDELYLVYMTPTDFQSVDINPFQTDDEDLIYCRSARRLHHGIIAAKNDDKVKIENLVRNLKTINRNSIRIKRQHARKIVEWLKPLGCTSYKENREENVLPECKPCIGLIPLAPTPAASISPVIAEIPSASATSASVETSTLGETSATPAVSTPLESPLEWYRFREFVWRCIRTILGWFGVSNKQ